MKYDSQFLKPLGKIKEAGYIEINKVVGDFLKKNDPQSLLYAVAVGLENSGYRKEAERVLDLSNKI